jgi:hypothetical protein
MPILAIRIAVLGSSMIGSGPDSNHRVEARAGFMGGSVGLVFLTVVMGASVASA